MAISIRNPGKLFRLLSIITLLFITCWGLLLVLIQIKPFWVDEWRIIYNLKYKSATALLGPLDFMQQFPRIYLVLIKLFTSFFDYSYFTLRLPSFLVGTFTIIFSYRLMRKMYPSCNLNRFLFIMILISSYAFTEYFVQIKQYTMDILLSLVALWQMAALLKLKDNNTTGRYTLLCISLFIVPFFSYTYPIAIAPVFIIMFLQSATGIINKEYKSNTTILLKQWFALALSVMGIILFYVIDVSQLMADKGMHQFWGHLIMDNGFSWKLLITNFYLLFAQVGSGLFFSIVFGILGIISFFYGIRKAYTMLLKNTNRPPDFYLFYSILLLVLVIALFIVGKFPLGESRLNAFTVPSISILIIYFLDRMNNEKYKVKFSPFISALLYIGAIGHIYTHSFAAITGPVYAREMNIYRSTENAIKLAQEKKLPILVTPGIAYPYDKTPNLPFKNTVPGDWVLKTFPAYKINENIPVYPLTCLCNLKEYMDQLPEDITTVLAGDGRSYNIINRY